jgi:hypothetical protein
VEWSRVHCYCGHWLAYCTRPEWQMNIVEESVEHCGRAGKVLGRGNRNTRRKPAPVSFCPPQIPHYPTRVRTRAAAVESRRLTAWATSRPYHTYIHTYIKYQFKLMKSLTGWLSWYSDWLRAGRRRGWSLSPDTVNSFLFSTSSRPAQESTQTPTCLGGYFFVIK